MTPRPTLPPVVMGLYLRAVLAHLHDGVRARRTLSDLLLTSRGVRPSSWGHGSCHVRLWKLKRLRLLLLLQFHTPRPRARVPGWIHVSAGEWIVDQGWSGLSPLQYNGDLGRGGDVLSVPSLLSLPVRTRP